MPQDATRIPNDLKPWIDARRRFRLSHAEVQMARELGMNSKKLGKLDSHRQERWKLPLPEYIATLYRKRFGKERPEPLRSIEEIAAARLAKNEARRARKNCPEAQGLASAGALLHKGAPV